MSSLNERLAALKAEKDAQRDPAATALMDNATEELRASGIMNAVAGPGDRAPQFARPDTSGRTIRLRQLLTLGPVVVSFFRGRW